MSSQLINFKAVEAKLTQVAKERDVNSTLSEEIIDHFVECGDSNNWVVDHSRLATLNCFGGQLPKRKKLV